MNKKIIFDLSSIIYEQGTKEDVRLLTNLILKYVIDQALRRGPMNELKHLVVIEDSQLLVPEVLREVPETTLGEDIPLLLRSVGEAMISVATRPRISDDIISNSAIKVTFRLNQADDTLKVSKYQNMNEEQEKYLRLLEKQEAIVTTLNFPHPFRIKTTTSYSKNVNNQEIIEHNLKNFPEMYENIEGLQKQPNLPNPINKELNRSKKNIDGNENYKKIGEQLSNWESKCLKNLSDDYKKAYLQIRTILAEPKTKSELIKKLDTSMDELNKFLNKFITLKLINYDFFPNFYSEVSIKRYHLNDNNNYIKLMIKEKLENDFKNSIQNSDINFFDYFVSSNKYYIKIFINRINDTNKYFFKELFSQWEEQIIKNKRSGLILIIPFISSIDAINSIIKENLKVPIIKIAYNEKSWEKLNKFFNDNTNLRTSGSQKNDNLLDIEKILNEIDNEGAHEIKELNQLLEENQEFKKKGNTNLDQNMSDENKIHSFLDNLQREIKEKSKK